MSEVAALGEVTVLSVGDVMLDESVRGKVKRISPEAPVPVVDVQRYSHTPGAASNVAMGVVALGGKLSLLASSVRIARRRCSARHSRTRECTQRT